MSIYTQSQYLKNHYPYLFCFPDHNQGSYEYPYTQDRFMRYHEKSFSSHITIRAPISIYRDKIEIILPILPFRPITERSR